jgi:hypothetical protein
MASADTEDPLIAALPPATDYLTYLTLLEYQLTPRNLPTLNSLLGVDDGKLAEEIGWDLLKLILPMLGDAPDTANECLQLVARRGNPREVVVRVAEELEKLGDSGDDEDDFDDDDKDELPTFPGEAPRVHLGDMTLDGMPQPDRSAPEKHIAPSKEVRFVALLQMLGVLHPRIKTQYPSRFLATSLPAALGAYRKVPITAASTAAVVTLLEKLGSKQRPNLPPRSGTVTESAPDVTAGQQSTVPPLPDPEAQGEAEQTGVKHPSDDEQAIVNRLLQAVLLEVLDEFMSSLADDEYPSMSWTVRAREKLEPTRTIPGRVTENETWTQNPHLVERDRLLATVTKLGQDVGLVSEQELAKLIHPDADKVDDDGKDITDNIEEPSEYPTSPSQIPFPIAGLIYLEASQLKPAYLDSTALTKLLAHSFPLSATPSRPLPALQDALLYLLYRQSRYLSSMAPQDQAGKAFPTPAKFLLLLSTLTQLFTLTPDPNHRAVTHATATTILHAYPNSLVRLAIIKQTLRGTTFSTNWSETYDENTSAEHAPKNEIVEETGLRRSISATLPHPIPLAPPQSLPQVKAIGVDWLKDEFLTFLRHFQITEKDASEKGTEPGLNPMATLIPDNGTELLDLLLPTDMLSPLQPTTAASKSSTTTDALSEYLHYIPLTISTLNLLCIIIPHLSLGLNKSASNTLVEKLRNRVEMYITAQKGSMGCLMEILSLAQSHSGGGGGNGDQEEGTEDVLAESRGDIFALEDASLRAKAAWEKIAG